MKDGGNAFPQIASFIPCMEGGMRLEVVDRGMSLRDYFAALAMQAQMTYGDCADMSCDGIAKHAYEYADAMLAERERELTKP